MKFRLFLSYLFLFTAKKTKKNNNKNAAVLQHARMARIAVARLQWVIGDR